MQDINLHSEGMAPEPYPYDHVREAMTFPSEELLCGVFDDKNKDVGRFIDFSRFEEHGAELIVAPRSKHQGLLLKVSSQAYNCFFARFMYIEEERPCDRPRPALQLFNSRFGRCWEVCWKMDEMKKRYAAKNVYPLFFAITDKVENLEHAKSRKRPSRSNVGTIRLDGLYQCKLPFADDVIIIWLGPKLELPFAPPPPARFDPSSATTKRVMDPMYGYDLPHKDFAGLLRVVDTEAMTKASLPKLKPEEIVREPSPEDTTTGENSGLCMKEGCKQLDSAYRSKLEHSRQYQ